MENSFDIFLSYDSKDLSIAEAFAQAFLDLGFNPFWDRTTILPGVNFPSYLKLSIDNSRLVVVLWSKHSVNSLWVESEARRAQKSAKLIPVFIEDIDDDDLPFGLEGIHSVRLSGWNGNRANEQFRLLMNAIGLRLKGDPIFKSENSVVALKIGHTITMELINNTIIRSQSRKNETSNTIEPPNGVNKLNPFLAGFKNIAKTLASKRSASHSSPTYNDDLMLDDYLDDNEDKELLLPPNENDFLDTPLQTETAQWVFEKLYAQSNISNSIIDKISDKTITENFNKRAHVIAPEIISKAMEIGTGRILRWIGTGGMTDVYLVWNPRMEVYRAFKVLKPAIPRGLAQRFETEIKIISNLNHPHIAQCYGAGEWYGLPYFEMEYVNGFNMEGFLSKGLKCLPEEAACIAEKICVALKYAHSHPITVYGKQYRGVIHRDLKPANILLTKGGYVKVVDFGISRPMGVSLHTLDSGTIVGTLPYIAPEQLSNSEASIFSDIYSLGLTLFEMVSGERAFPQTTVTELVNAKSSTPKIMYMGNESILEKAIGAVISKATALVPSERFANTGEMQVALRKVIALQKKNVPSILRRITQKYSSV